MYDENHQTVCDKCCTHPGGWWKLEESYGNDNGKYACKRGCGTIVADPSRSIKKGGDSNDNNSLMELTKGALFDVLGRMPTEQEILRAHAGFKRMAFTMMDHIQRQDKDSKNEK